MRISEAKKRDLQVIMQKDPAATSSRIVRRTYTGYKALCAYRYAHLFWQKGMKSLALYIAYRAKEKTGIDIHPAATIGNGIFIDHGVGLVIGETAEIGDNCVLYQGVTLGGTGKETGKRHPTLEEGVMVSAGAKVLGPVRIGEHSKIGAGSVVLKDVPPAEWSSKTASVLRIWIKSVFPIRLWKSSSGSTSAFTSLKRLSTCTLAGIP